jgi:tetratricopeptide (TPR) repeat protein
MRYFYLFITLLFSSCVVDTTDKSKDDLSSDKSTLPMSETKSDTIQVETTDIQLLSDLIENDSKNDSLLVERALINISRGNLKEAKNDLETAILIDITNGHTHYLLADVLLELARKGEGSEKTLKLSSFHFKSAIKYKYNSALSLQKDGLISMYLADYYQAIVLLSKSVAVDDTDSKTYILLGNCYRKLDKVENAIHSFQKAISLNTNSDEAYVQLGQLFWEKEDSTAIQYYKSAISINPNNRAAYYNLGLVYRTIKEQSKSIDVCHKIIEFGIKDMYFVEAHYNIALILMEDEGYKEKHHHKNALNNYLIELVRVAPDHYRAYWRMGMCYEKLGDVINAEEHYRKALEINPEFKEATDKLTQLLSNNEKYPAR